MRRHILYITSSRLKGLMNNERWQLINAFKRAGHTILDLEEDKDSHHDLVRLVNNKKQKYDLIIFEETSWAIKLGFNLYFKNSNLVPIPKATFISDYWIYTQEFCRLLKHNDIKSFLCCHEGAYPYIGKTFSGLIDHVCWVPLTIDSSEFDFPPQVKKYDFFLSGATTALTPFRGRVIELVKNKFRNYRVFHLEHPGHWRKGENVGVRGKEYYKMLAQSWFCLSTCGIYNISSRKYWEISAAGSTIFGNETGLPEHLLIKNNLVHITEKMSDREIVKVLQRAYNNKENWKNRARETASLVKNCVSTEVTVKRIEEFIDKLSLPLPKPENITTKYKKKLHRIFYYDILKRLPDKV